jgi:hypothetical protein
MRCLVTFIVAGLNGFVTAFWAGQLGFGSFALIFLVNFVVLIIVLYLFKFKIGYL